MAGAYKSRSFRGSSFSASKRVAAYAKATGARGKVMAKQRGYVRTGGYYGRFNRGRRTGFSGAELKFLDTSRTGTVATAGVVDPNICTIIQDTTETGRIGRKVVIKSISVKGTLTLLGASGPTDKIRMIMVQDQQANGATFAVTDLLETAGINAHYNLENQMRFKVLSDQTFAFHIQAAATNVIRHLSRYYRCNIPMEYSAATGAITEQRSNSVAILWITASGVASAITTTRIRYSDVG